MTAPDLDAAGAIRVERAARARIRTVNSARRTVVAVLDDDPTGSQTVHNVEVVTVAERGELAEALEAGSACFVLTNTRAMPEDAAVRTNWQVAGDLLRAASASGRSLELVSRGDSTLRGHVVAEVDALRAAHWELTGHAFDGVLFVPAYLEAGRLTAGDTHWARVGADLRPVAETEFARDATFGYSASNLPRFLAERSGGAIRAGDVQTIGLDDIRRGGPDRVREILAGVRAGSWVVVNAAEYADLDVVALGVLAAGKRGQRFVHRSGPSWVQVLAGLDPAPPLTAQRIAAGGVRPGHGLVVVGSHVDRTSRQVAAATAMTDLAVIELDAGRLSGPDDPGYRAETASAAAAALAERDVLLLTSRELLRGADRAASLRLAGRVSAGVAAVVREVVAARPPAWVLTKGGITSHEVATSGLGIRRARVAGQLFPGTVSLLRPTAAPAAVLCMPWVVFAGNVGGDETLGEVVRRLAGREGERACGSS